MNLLCLLLPTNEPDTYFKYFDSSLEYLKEIASVTTISYNFQKPWTNDQIEQAIKHAEQLGFKTIYSYNSYTIERKGEVPFNKIRNQCYEQAKGFKYYALCDDDFLFGIKNNKTSGQQYIDILYYLNSHPRCGLVLQKSHSPYFKPNIINKTRLNDKFATGMGYIFRSLEDSLGFGYIPNDAIELVGAGEEKLVAAARLNEGLYPAVLSGSSTKHIGVGIGKKKEIKSGDETYGWITSEIFENNVNKYIREHYNPKCKGIYNYNVVTIDSFLAKGGVIDTTDNAILDCTKTNYTVNDLLT